MKCDVFSLGAVLYELLSDRMLFGGQTREFILQENLSYKPTFDHFNQEIRQLL
jgi:serine/threonine protein kinase